RVAAAAGGAPRDGADLRLRLPDPLRRRPPRRRLPRLAPPPRCRSGCPAAIFRRRAVDRPDRDSCHGRSRGWTAAPTEESRLGTEESRLGTEESRLGAEDRGWTAAPTSTTARRGAAARG